MIGNLSKKINKPLAKNSFYLYLSHFGDYAFSMLALPFVARILGPKELAYVATTQTFGLLLLLVMDFGFSLTASREVAKLENKKDLLIKFINKAFSFKILLALLVLLLSFIVINIVPIFNLRPHYIFIVMIGSIFQGLAPIWFFQGIEKFKYIAFSRIIFRLIGFIIIIVFINDSDDGWIVLSANALTSCFIFIYLFKNLLSLLEKIEFFNFKGLKDFWFNGHWVFSLTLIPTIYINSSLIILSTIINPFQLGLYLGVAKIYNALNSLYSPIGQVIYPRFIASNISEKEKTIKLVRKFFFILLFIGLIFCALLISFPGIIIKILLGKEFLDAIPTLQLFALVLPLTSVTHILGRQWMLVNGKEKKYSIIIMISSILAFIFFLFNIQNLGIKVMPLSLIIFELSTIVMILIVEKHLSFK